MISFSLVMVPSVGILLFMFGVIAFFTILFGLPWAPFAPQ